MHHLLRRSHHPSRPKVVLWYRIRRGYRVSSSSHSVHPFIMQSSGGCRSSLSLYCIKIRFSCRRLRGVSAVAFVVNRMCVAKASAARHASGRTVPSPWSTSHAGRSRTARCGRAPSRGSWGSCPGCGVRGPYGIYTHISAQPSM